MTALLSNFRNTMIVSTVLALVMVFVYFQHSGGNGHLFGEALLRWLHVFFGILWIGLLYYFNFVQIRVMPAVPAELKPAVTRYIAPEALFWFRWAALGTVLAGFALMATRGHAYSAEALSFGFAAGYGPEDRGFTLLGVGIWLAIVMFLNVWGVIWPNQKRALGIVVVDDDKKAHAARVAMLGSRINLLLSLPMLTSMAMYQTLLG